MDKILWMLFAHFIADGALQPERYAMQKNFNIRYMVNHCIIYSGVVSCFMFFLGNYALWKSLIILISHFIIDNYITKSNNIEKSGRLGWTDLAFHLAILGGVLW